MEELLSGSVIANGAKPLERLWSVRLPGKQVDRELNQMLLREAKNFKMHGFRRGSKVVPPAFRRLHEPRLRTDLLSRMAEPSLKAKIRDSGLDILPSVMIKDQTREGDELEVTYQFEIRPEIPPPKLDGVKLLRPVAKIEAADEEKVSERLCRQHAQWSDVARPTAEGDKVRFRLASGQEQEAELNHALAESVRGQLLGKKPGDSVEIDPGGGDGSPAFKVEITAVLSAQVPQLDLSLAQKIIPEVKSMEEFHSQIASQIKDQAAKLVRSVLSRRVIYLLVRSTDEFELPEQHIATLASKRREQILHNARQQGQNLSVEHIDTERLLAAASAESRTSLVISAYVQKRSIAPSDEAIKDFIANEAKEHTDPQQFIDFAMKDEQTRDAVAREVTQDAINAAFMAEVETIDEQMSIDQLGAAQQGADPFLTPPEQPGEGAERDEGGKSGVKEEAVEATNAGDGA